MYTLTHYHKVNTYVTNTQVKKQEVASPQKPARSLPKPKALFPSNITSQL